MDNTTGRKMNVLLKFSWGHILAFLAVIAIAYGTFVGLTYRLDGDYVLAGVGTFVAATVIILCFTALQHLKGTDSDFAWSIKWERVLFCIFPFLLTVLMVPFLHAWTVHSREDAIKERFSQSIRDSRQMFDDYEEYASGRCADFREVLGKKRLTKIQQDNRARALEVALLYRNEDSLRTVADRWIVKSSGRVSTWNIFLLGSIDRTEAALKEWHRRLEDISRVKFSGEALEGEYWFDPNQESLSVAVGGLESLRELYTRRGFKPLSLLFVLAGWFLLMLPYFLQRRHSRNWYTLLPSGRGGAGQSAGNLQEAGPEPEPEVEMDRPSPGDEDDLGSFTL